MAKNRVGYRKPPENSRFKAGQSGNPKGRPIGTKNLKTDLGEELQKVITVREGPRAIKISKQLAIIKTLIAKTLRGDARAAITLTSMMYKVLDLGDDALPADAPLGSYDIEILEAFKRRLLASAPPVAASPVEGVQPVTVSGDEDDRVAEDKVDSEADGDAS